MDSAVGIADGRSNRGAKSQKEQERLLRWLEAAAVATSPTDVWDEPSAHDKLAQDRGDDLERRRIGVDARSDICIEFHAREVAFDGPYC